MKELFSIVMLFQNVCFITNHPRIGSHKNLKNARVFVFIGYNTLIKISLIRVGIGTNCVWSVNTFVVVSLVSVARNNTLINAMIHHNISRIKEGNVLSGWATTLYTLQMLRLSITFLGLEKVLSRVCDVTKWQVYGASLRGPQHPYEAHCRVWL